MAKGNVKIEIGVDGEPLRSLTDKVKPVKSVKAEVEELSNPVNLASRLDHPVIISYDGQGLVIPPKGRIMVANKNKLGAIPSGVILLKS